MTPKARGDKAIDLAIAEQPSAPGLDHPVVIGAAGADLGTLRAVLHDRPVRTNIGRRFAVERDHDIGDHMDAARPVVAAPGADTAWAAIASRPVALPKAVSQVPFSANKA